MKKVTAAKVAKFIWKILNWKTEQSHLYCQLSFKVADMQATFGRSCSNKFLDKVECILKENYRCALAKTQYVPAFDYTEFVVGNLQPPPTFKIESAYSPDSIDSLRSFSNAYQKRLTEEIVQFFEYSECLYKQEAPLLVFGVLRYGVDNEDDDTQQKPKRKPNIEFYYLNAEDKSKLLIQLNGRFLAKMSYDDKLTDEQLESKVLTAPIVHNVICAVEHLLGYSLKNIKFSIKESTIFAKIVNIILS